VKGGNLCNKAMNTLHGASVNCNLTSQMTQYIMKQATKLKRMPLDLHFMMFKTMRGYAAHSYVL
jgi:hypothetical protein